MNKRKVEFFSCYPFTYDGQFRFHPIKMLYHQESYISQIPYNLDITSFVNNQQTGLNEFKKNIYIWLLSEIINLILFINISYFFFNNILIELFILFLSGLVQQYLRYSELHFGYLYVLKSDQVLLFIASKIPSKFITFETLNSLIAEVNKKQIYKNEYKVVIQIIVNYLYKCIHDEYSNIPLSQLEEILKIEEKSQVDQVNCLKLLGIVGLYTNNPEYTLYALTEFKVLIEYYESIDYNGVMKHAINSINLFIMFLSSSGRTRIKKRQLLINYYDIYSYYGLIDRKILNIIS